MNLVNKTVTYAVEDIVLGDLIKNKHISFWWIDWQQGGSAGMPPLSLAPRTCTPHMHPTLLFWGMVSR